MINIKGNQGITLTILVIMIIVIIILAGISITKGSDLIKTTKVETNVTNMITMRAKAKVFAEEVNAEVWDETDKSSKREEIYLEKYKMTKPENETELISKVSDKVNNEYGCECYGITKDTLEEMGLKDLAKEVDNEDYVIVYNSNDYRNIDIIYTKGIEYENKIYYTLSSLQGAIGE